MSLSDRCRSIEFILSDVDGVLTDGGIIFDNQGIETKQFHSRDGLGIKLWRPFRREVRSADGPRLAHRQASFWRVGRRHPSTRL